MPPYHYQPRPRDPNRFPYTKIVTVVFLGILGLVIAWAALASPPSYPKSTAPVHTTEQADVTEQRIVLTDGRTLLCLHFPDQQLTCDWSRAYRGVT